MIAGATDAVRGVTRDCHIRNPRGIPATVIVRATQRPITIHWGSNRARSFAGVAAAAPTGKPLTRSPMMVMTVAVRVAAVRVAVRIVVHARILAEDQGFDRHRHGERGHAYPSEVDVIEIPERDAIDCEHLRADAPLLLEEGAERLGDVAAKDYEQGLRRGQRARQGVAEAARDSRPEIGRAHV